MVKYLLGDISAGTEIVIKIISVVVFIGLWAVGSLQYHSLILPSPLETAQRFYDIFASGLAWNQVGITALRAMTGFVVCVVMSLVLGVGGGLFPAVGAFLYPLERLMVSVPPIAWVVLTIIWFGGSGIGSAVTTIAISSFPLVYVATLQGVRTIDTGLLDMGRSFGMSHGRAVIKIGAIHVLSVTFPALTITFGQSWKVGVMAEVLGASNGIGAQISSAQVNMETADVLAWVSVAVILFVITDKLFIEPINTYTMKWR